MDLFSDDLLDDLWSSTVGGVLDSTMDSLGLSRHGRDQVVNQRNNKELMALQNEYNQENFWTQFNAQNQEFRARYNEMESPQARVQQLKAAGINPASVLGGNASFGVPSGASNPPSVSVPQVHPAGMGQVSDKGTSDYIDALSRMKLSDAQSQEIFDLLKGKIEAQDWENKVREQILFYKKFENELNRIYGSEERSSKVRNLVFEGLRDEMASKESSANAKFLEAKMQLINDEHLKNNKELPYLTLMFDAMIQMWRKQGAYYGAAASNQAAQAATENKLRDVHYDLLSFERDSAKAQSNVDTATQWARIRELVNKAKASDILPENARVALEMAEKENNLYYAKAIIGMCSEAVTTAMSVRTGGRIASAMEVRNEIQQRMFEYQKDNGVSETVVNSYNKNGKPTGTVHTVKRKRPQRGR